MNVIEVKNISHNYGSKSVLNNLSFAVSAGGIVGLLGKNGVGKSTLNNIFHGFLQPSAGAASIFGEDCSSISPETKARIAILLEGHIQYPFFNVVELERFFSSIYSKWKSSIYWDLIELLEVKKSQKIGSMSYGQRSQVALAQLLAQDADLLILDDFSMGLDSGYRRLFVDYLRQYVKGSDKTVFATSHIIQDMERLIDNVMIMTDKGIIVQDSISNFMRNIHGFEFHISSTNFPFASGTKPIEKMYRVHNKIECYSYLNKDEFVEWLKQVNVEIIDIEELALSLEDAFIGLTGKY